MAASGWIVWDYKDLRDLKIELHHTAGILQYYFKGNWTEWNAIWLEIILVDSKLNERAARRSHKYDFRPKLHSNQFD